MKTDFNFLLISAPAQFINVMFSPDLLGDGWFLILIVFISVQAYGANYNYENYRNSN